jgi:hypothetical protein
MNLPSHKLAQSRRDLYEPPLNGIPHGINREVFRNHYTARRELLTCTSRMNLIDLAGSPCLVFEPEPLNAFVSIEAVLAATFDQDPVEAYFWEQSDIPSPWDT